MERTSGKRAAYKGKRENRPQEKGFTLVEIMLVVCLFAIGILGLLSMQVTAISGNTTAKLVTESTYHAQDKMEELMAVAYDNSDLDDGNHQVPAGDLPQGCEAIEWQVTEDPDIDGDGTPDEDLKLITVTVTWGDKGGMNRDTRLTSIKRFDG